ncbi:MAG: BrnT family toxin [Proteobacteria bacterium]|nr:BrnT family toxin [Pseudomonadota bacterium]MBU1584841.1 BrnT family toxin [Pseudomonadota bacterium]MBU2456112.1 BrnT family toxin [Pseudomonadota bacterium]MBU2632080.1 BrnT family toxin [Pseudomonadota bacterium]
MDSSHIKLLNQCIGFEWDKGNIDKNWMKHKVTPSECEQIFFNHPLLVQDDTLHSNIEKRYYALGKTDIKRLLFVVFTLRNKLIRVISARDMSRKERKAYKNGKENT